MNAMIHALKDANARTPGVGIVLPTVGWRIWHWLKDNGAHTSLQVALALGMVRTDTSSALSILVSRGMLAASQGSERGRDITYYSTCIREYELLPRKHTRKAKAKLRTLPVTPVLDLQPVSADETQAVASISTDPRRTDKLSERRIDVSSMTVRDAQELYLELHALFGGRG